MNYNKFIFLIIALIGVCGAKETDKKDLTDGQIWYLFIYNIYKGCMLFCQLLLWELSDLYVLYL